MAPAIPGKIIYKREPVLKADLYEMDSVISFLCISV